MVAMRDLLNEAAAGGKDPVAVSQQAMKPALPRRFYKEAKAAPGEAGHGVFLDGRPVRTPGRQLLELPTLAAASQVAGEFAAQGEFIDPADMPATRLANTTIDGIVPDMQPVLEDISRFAASDLLCYRAATPRELVARQGELWDPVIDWLRDELGANFVLAEGVVHVSQPREAMALFAARLRAHAEPFRLACLHTVTSLTGSAFLALAVAEDRIDAQEAWKAGNLDEDWNSALWGEDAEAAHRRADRWRQMAAACSLLASLPKPARPA